MKFISQEQRAKARLRLEVATSALLATLLVSTLVVIGNPGYLSTARSLIGA